MSLVRIASTFLLSIPLAAQCVPAPVPADGIPGVAGRALAFTRWDPDGAGPLGEHLVVGGAFEAAGTVRGGAIAAFDPGSGAWRPIGRLDGRVQALAVLANGDLVAGGAFGVVPGAVDTVVRFDGTNWVRLGAGISYQSIESWTVRSLAVRPNGDLIAAGSFTIAGGVPAHGIARWNGAVWQSIGNLDLPFLAAAGDAVVALPNGDVVVGGFFTHAGGVPSGGIARWDGSTWSAMDAGLFPLGVAAQSVRRLFVRSNGRIVAAGLFQLAGGASPRVAEWNGSSWTPLGAGVPGFVEAIAELPGGELLLGGQNVVTGSSAAQFVGGVWSAVPSTPASAIDAFGRDASGRLFAGGAFAPTPQFLGRGLARYDALGWQAVGAGSDGRVARIVPLAGNTLLVLGEFATIGGVFARRAATFDGAQWRPAGEPAAGTVVAAAAGVAGEAYAAWAFGPNGPSHVQRFDGSSWTLLGVCTGLVQALAVAPNGDLWVGGSFASVAGQSVQGFAIHDGLSWQAGPAGLSFVRALHRLRDGRLVVSGQTVPVGSAHVGVFDGAQWSALGAGLAAPAVDLDEAVDGAILAAGEWPSVGAFASPRVARFDGANWQPLGAGVGGPIGGGPSGGGDEVVAITALPNGDVLAGGRFAAASGVPASNLARFDGANWHAVGAVDAPVAAMHADASGTIVVGGSFTRFGGVVSAHLGRFAPTCPAVAAAFGSGCGVPLPVLGIETPAWLGGVLRSATSAPNASLGLAVVGFAPTFTPLQPLVPQAPLGCHLLAAPDLSFVVSSAAGRLRAALPLPRTPALLGGLLWHQVLPVEATAASFVLTASNGAALVLGAMW
jgi:trimeric autotransporter adhesin